MQSKYALISTCACILVAILLAASSLVYAIPSAQAQVVPAQISEYKISPKPDNFLISGVDYKVEFTLDIAAGIGGNLVLETDLERSTDRFWELKTRDYEGVNLQSWKPGQNTISFNAAAGTPTFVLTGYVPADATTNILQHPTSGTITLHWPGTLCMLSFSLESGDVLEKLNADVIDDSILRYNDKIKNWSQALNENPDLKKEIEKLADAGYTDQAIAILDTIPRSGWGTSDDSSTILYIVLAVIAVIAVAAIVVTLRSRSTIGFVKQRVVDQADKLDLVESRLHKLGEKSLINDVTQIRDSLREMGRR